MEEKEVNLEDLGSKLKNLEREKLKLVRDLEQWNGEQSKLDTFERENRDLMQVCAYSIIHNGVRPVFYIHTISRDMLSKPFFSRNKFLCHLYSFFFSCKKT